MMPSEKHLCPVCASELVMPRGPKNADVLIISEMPGEDELASLIPFTGRSGKHLRKELALVGLDMGQFRITNLWSHEPNDNEACYEYSLNLCLSEAKDKQIILLLGSDCAKTFVGKGVMEVSGLLIHSDILSAPFVMCCPNPAIFQHQPIGEFRLAISKFSKLVKETIK